MHCPFAHWTRWPSGSAVSTRPEAAPSQSSAGLSRTTCPTTTIAGGLQPRCGNIVGSAGERRFKHLLLVCGRIGHESHGLIGRCARQPISREAIVAMCFIAMYITITWLPRATPSQSIRSGTTPEASWPVRNVTV
jgi:hypothetical protein